jgi:hypothetical protein
VLLLLSIVTIKAAPCPSRTCEDKRFFLNGMVRIKCKPISHDCAAKGANYKCRDMIQNFNGTRVVIGCECVN